MTSPTDIHYMRHALSLAGRGVGRTAPNPAVGCVIVSAGGHIVGRGVTADGGRPHAEAAALSQAGDLAKKSTVYVTLEPCSHQGQTPPCARGLIDAGAARVVVACGDPDPRVSGRGVAMLRTAGIDVVEGVLEEEALALNAGFFLRITKERPFVTLKLATSNDHKIADAPGQRTQISGEMAGRFMHLTRSRHDAILVGANTARVDRPKLTTRIEGYSHEVRRFVLGASDVQGLSGITDVDTNDIEAVLNNLAERGITRLLVEGGAKTHTSFLRAGFCDQFLWVKSPHEIGAGGVDALAGHDIGQMGVEFGLELKETRALGEDLLAIYTPSA